MIRKMSKDYDSECRRLESQIAQKRGEIDRTIDAIRERISPEHTIKPLIDKARDTVGLSAGKLSDTVKENPMPILLMGVGMGWMILNNLLGARRRSEGVEAAVAGGPIEESGEAAGGKLREGISSIGQKVGGVAARVRERAKAIGGETRHRVGRASDWFASTLDENPILLATGALAAGVLAGLAFPASRAEEETLGSLGEKAARSAADKAREALEKEPAASRSPEGHAAPSVKPEPPRRDPGA